MNPPASAQAQVSRFSRLVVRSLPYVPKGVVQRVAGRYIGGETIEQVIDTASMLAREGAMATVDLLGEEVEHPEQAEQATAQYLDLLDQIEAVGLQDCNISVKLTMLGLRIDDVLCVNNLTRLAKEADFVRIDMEDHTCTDATLQIYRALQPALGNLGVVIQSMLHRSVDDVDQLVRANANVRLVKGIYREPASIALQDPDAIRERFIVCLQRLLEGGCYTAIATHDDVLVQETAQMVREMGLGTEHYEFQMLHGVRPELRRRVLADGHPLRVYIPYGANWYAYSLRRLRENPDVARHVMRALFRRG